MKAFVTGATGFLGTHLVNALRARGDDVACLVRSPAKAAARNWRDVRMVRGDLDDAAALREGCAGADVVFHIAGRIAARDQAEFMASNRDGTANVLAAAALDPPQRFVFVSSLAVAGPTVPGRPVDETREPAPVTPYGRSKLAGELLVRSGPMPWTIIRPPVVYGEWDEALVDLFRLARRGVVPMFGDGSQEISVIHGADLAAAFVAVATSERAAGRVYFASHRATITTRELALAVGRAVGRRPRLLPLPEPVARAVLWTVGSAARLAGRAAVLSLERAPEFFAPAWTCRADALRADTGWEARVDLDPGLERAAAWYREAGWLN
ncbi:MAG TPA: NAD(P)-dependent oxidoreductase [Gemmatimonadales bacterium]|nr:NAD(P)-dependent oxidoreductase [Gemmatimonadales bacterium]